MTLANTMKKDGTVDHVFVECLNHKCENYEKKVVVPPLELYPLEVKKF